MRQTQHKEINVELQSFITSVFDGVKKQVNWTTVKSKDTKKMSVLETFEKFYVNVSDNITNDLIFLFLGKIPYDVNKIVFEYLH